MAISQDGNDLIWEGQVRITNAFDITTGVATLILTPAGGVGDLPVLASGGPGKPPVFDSVSVVQVDPASPLPDPVLTLVSPGGAGVASHYTLTIYMYSGAKGDTGASTNILAAPDVDTTGISNTFILSWDATAGKIKFVAQKVGGLYIPASISSTAGNSGARSLCSITVPSQPFDWRPMPFAQTVVVGTANVRVDLIAKQGDANSGDQVGRGFGLVGPNAPPITVIPAPGGQLNGNYGKVLAGNTGVIWLRAETQVSTTDAWTTSSSTTLFSVAVQPIF